ncbi:MAG: alpha-galactosidase [Lachnospiraceae bacterium]|nr:alpha-galactosidase [Lachnospiraceae bacterium]
MIRHLHEESNEFVLDTDNTTYAFRVTKSGHPEHLYYGKRINIFTADDLIAFTQKREFEPGNVIVYSPEHRTTILEDMCLEMSSGGHGDIREPFVEIVHADGSRSSDFLYSDYEITQEKPEFKTLPGSYSEHGNVEHLCVTLVDDKLTLKLHYYVYPECDVITRSAELINNGVETVEIERLLSLQLDLPDSGYAFTSFHGAWAREMNKSTVVLNVGKFVNESRAGCSSSRANPFFMLHSHETTEDSGACYGFNLIYSGNHYSVVEVNAFGKTRVVSGINPQGFRVLLESGESFEAPEAVMTYSADGFTGQSINMHKFVREHIVRGEWRDKARPVLLNSWEACYFDISEGGLVSLAKSAKNLGIELFVMDDGWFGERNDDGSSLGDWDANLKKLPGGLKRLGEKITSLGLQFGIWVEPEMVNVQSKLYEQHPDWVMQIPGKLHSEGRNQRILDFANPEVTDYIIKKMSEVFSSADISYVKWDMNRIFSDVYSPYLPAKRQGETAHRYICGLYHVMDELTKRFPHILFEGCASGGNRFDLGILCYFPQIWGSDNTDAISRLTIQEGYSYGYPLSCVGAHVAASPNHQTLRRTTLKTRFGVAAFGALGYECDLRDLKSEEKLKIIGQINVYKKWRDVFQSGQFYRIKSGNTYEWLYVSKDKKRAVGLLVQKLVKPNTQYERFVAKGLDPDMRYRFYVIPERVDIKQFGSLVNTLAPIHVKQDSFVHNVIARAVKMSGEMEEYNATGDLLMSAGVALKQAFSGTGFNDNVRVFGDFASRMYFIEAIE